jgi:hypothetical protein
MVVVSTGAFEFTGVAVILADLSSPGRFRRHRPSDCHAQEFRGIFFPQADARGHARRRRRRLEGRGSCFEVGGRANVVNPVTVAVFRRDAFEPAD